LVAFEYAVASDHYYQLLRITSGQFFVSFFANGEEAVIRVLHVDEEYEDSFMTWSQQISNATSTARQVAQRMCRSLPI